MVLKKVLILISLVNQDKERLKSILARVIREISRQDSQKGNDIHITIDLRIQQYALNLLKEHRQDQRYLWILKWKHLMYGFYPIL